MNRYEIHQGNNLDALRELAPESIDSVVTDPPYGISFMGKKWDYDVPSVELWKEVYRVLKPGGHMLVACGTRTQHRMVLNIEDAGFEIRDVVTWLYGSGFPKSHDISKNIDKKLGAVREVTGTQTCQDITGGSLHAESKRPQVEIDRHDKPATPEAEKWDGWGTALKPAVEFFTLCRKPFEGSVVDNVLKHGTGGINVDGCRIGDEGGTTRSHQAEYAESGWRVGHEVEGINKGRWPANLIHDGSDEVIKGMKKFARYFYCPKAQKKDRNNGLGHLPKVQAGSLQGSADGSLNGGHIPINENFHPTVKPTPLMRYLVRMVTPKNGRVLDPYMGSGSTGKAAMLEGFYFTGMELDERYFEIAKGRIEYGKKNRGCCDVE